jgi:cysteine-rich repeat protein
MALVSCRRGVARAPTPRARAIATRLGPGVVSGWLVACGPPLGADGESSSTTELAAPDAATCSDAIVQRNEPCDDANDLFGDGCNPGCVESGAEVGFSIWYIEWTPRSLAIDSAGAPWISGHEFGDSVVMRFDANLGIVPAVELPDVDGARIAFASDGQLVIAGNEDSKIHLERRTRGGTQLWSHTMGDPFDIGDVFVSDDRILLSGSIWRDPASGYDAHVAVFDRDGVALWSADYNGPFDGTQIAREVVADAAGDVYVVGLDAASHGFDDTEAGAHDTDVWLRKYSAAGDVVWTQRHDGLAGHDDEAMGAAITPAGDVLVVGLETTSDGWRTIDLAASFAPNGAPWWIARRDRGPEVTSVVRAVAHAGNGDAFVAGAFIDDDGAHDFVARLDATGAVSWERSRAAIGEGGGAFDVAIDDGSGDVVVLGFDRDADGVPWTWVWRLGG